MLIDGNRLLITGGVALGFFLLTWGFVSYDLLSVGPRSAIQSILGSGVVAGLFSLISVTLAINQLISSRVFGALSSLQQKLEGGTELRATVSDIADHPSPPLNTADCISFIGTTVEDQAVALQDEYDHPDAELNETIGSHVADVNGYAGDIQEISHEMPPERVISTLAGPEFAYHLSKTDELRSKHHARLTADEQDTLDAIVTLLGALSVFRQYFKTIALHQELAQLSRQFIFVAFPAVVVALLAPLIYETNPAHVLSTPPSPIISASLTVVIVPLLLVLAYMLRISTIFRYTITVAPFIPPAEWPWSQESD